MFKQNLYVPYYAHNDEYMCIVVSGGNDFMESMSECLEGRWSGVYLFLGMV